MLGPFTDLSTHQDKNSLALGSLSHTHAHLHKKRPFCGLSHIFFFSSTACGRGFYKSSSQDLQCSRCPAHSFNDREGSWRCDCEDGYYRALADPPSAACTSMSVTPHITWLTIEKVTHLSVLVCSGDSPALPVFSSSPLVSSHIILTLLMMERSHFLFPVLKQWWKVAASICRATPRWHWLCIERCCSQVAAACFVSAFQPLAGKVCTGNPPET